MKTGGESLQVLIGFFSGLLVIATLALASYFFVIYFGDVMPKQLLIIYFATIVYLPPTILYSIYRKKEPMIGRGILISIFLSPFLIAFSFTWYIFYALTHSHLTW